MTDQTPQNQEAKANESPDDEESLPDPTPDDEGEAAVSADQNGDSEAAAPTDEEPSLGMVAGRDVAAAVAALTLWGAADTWAIASNLGLASFIAVVDATLVGLLLAFFVHEWGHYTGAKLKGANVRLVPPAGLSPVRYDFDMENNSREQFNWMSLGGNIGLWVALIVALWLIPLDSVGRVAFVSAVVAFTVFSAAAEMPIVLRTLREEIEPAIVLKDLDAAVLKRSAIIGGIVGIGFYLFAI